MSFNSMDGGQQFILLLWTCIYSTLKWLGCTHALAQAHQWPTSVTSWRKIMAQLYLLEAAFWRTGPNSAEQPAYITKHASMSLPNYLLVSLKHRPGSQPSHKNIVRSVNLIRNMIMFKKKREKKKKLDFISTTSGNKSKSFSTPRFWFYTS